MTAVGTMVVAMGALPGVAPEILPRTGRMRTLVSTIGGHAILARKMEQLIVVQDVFTSGSGKMVISSGGTRSRRHSQHAALRLLLRATEVERAGVFQLRK